MDFESYAAKHRPNIEKRLEELLPREAARPATLHRAMRYAVMNGGKRFRPLLCIASAEAVRGNQMDALDAACAVELVHCFSLTHDDLPALDDDALRRGKPSCHVEFGEALALLAGDALFALAFETLAQMPLSPETNFECVKALAKASGTEGMVGGQTLDIETEGKPADEELVKWIHQRKTGALMAASCRLGAITGGAGKADVESCARFGELIGLAFQIADDLLDETSKTQTLGKTAGSDARSHKATFPAVMGSEASRKLAAQSSEGALEAIGRFGARAEGLRALSEFATSRAF